MYIAKFAFVCCLLVLLRRIWRLGYLADEIPRRGVMSRVCPDMLERTRPRDE
jgi:hypothetical protein